MNTTQEFGFIGAVAHEFVSSATQGVPAIAHQIANFFMNNMDTDVMVNDLIHAANLTIKAGALAAPMEVAAATQGADLGRAAIMNAMARATTPVRGA